MMGFFEHLRTLWITARLRRRYSLPKGDYHFGKGFDFRFSPSGRLELKPPLYVDNYACIKCKGHLVIGARSFINLNVMIACREEIVIGSGVIIANNVSIYDHDHKCDDSSRPYVGQGYVTAPVCIGDNVWIGAGVTILKGVSIGRNAIIAAGAVVAGDVPMEEVWGGVPAKFIRQVRPK